MDNQMPVAFWGSFAIPQHETEIKMLIPDNDASIPLSSLVASLAFKSRNHSSFPDGWT
jgi:hypothetical protein